MIFFFSFFDNGTSNRSLNASEVLGVSKRTCWRFALLECFSSGLICQFYVGCLFL